MADQERQMRMTISMAARRTGVQPKIVRYCIRVGLISQQLNQAELAELRRVRRLHELGVNMAGVEIILRMRKRIERLEAQLERL